MEVKAEVHSAHSLYLQNSEYCSGRFLSPILSEENWNEHCSRNLSTQWIRH